SRAASSTRLDRSGAVPKQPSINARRCSRVCSGADILFIGMLLGANGVNRTPTLLLRLRQGASQPLFLSSKPTPSPRSSYPIGCEFLVQNTLVLYSITKHAMRRSADEIGATSISFRPKVVSDPASVVD